MTPAEILVAHQWKFIDREGRFVCKSGCCCVPRSDYPERINEVEARHQAEKLLAFLADPQENQPQ